MDEEKDKEDKDAEFERKKGEMERKDREKTDKNRAKREKARLRKEKGKSGKMEVDGEEQKKVEKKKFVPNVGIKRDGAEGAGEEMVVEEQGITFHDED